MTEITREELELCAELLNLGLTFDADGNAWVTATPTTGGRFFNPLNSATYREALAKAAKLIVNYRDDNVKTPDGEYLFRWPIHGTYEACVIKASAAVMQAGCELAAAIGATMGDK